jgi:N6-adenosine-specific RNA methylase IME4
MERHEILEAMSELKLYGMRASFDEGQVRELATGAFLDAKRNAIFIGGTGAGYIFRSAAEFLICATRGEPAWKREEGSRSIRNLIYAPVREHSRKPDAQYAMAEALSAGPYVELFSRTSRPGWDHFGDQAEAFGEVAALHG